MVSIAILRLPLGFVVGHTAVLLCTVLQCKDICYVAMPLVKCVEEYGYFEKLSVIIRQYYSL